MSSQPLPSGTPVMDGSHPQGLRCWSALDGHWNKDFGKPVGNFLFRLAERLVCLVNRVSRRSPYAQCAVKVWRGPWWFNPTVSRADQPPRARIMGRRTAPQNRDGFRGRSVQIAGRQSTASPYCLSLAAGAGVRFARE